MVQFDLSKLLFMSAKDLKVDNVQCQVTRCGYTGEDGFEIQIPNTDVVRIANSLLNKQVALSGLGSRDTLRLEAGLCLMGHDMNNKITPIEADLGWSIGKRRKEEGNFLGAKVILDQLKNGVTSKRVGFLVSGKVAGREGFKIFDSKEKEIGVVTSGGPAPSLESQGIGMGYVTTENANIGNKIWIEVRGKKVEAEIS